MAIKRVGRCTVAVLAIASVAACGAENVVEPASPPAAAADPDDKGLRSGLLSVAGGSLSGTLLPVPPAAGDARDTFLWQSPWFAAPFEFRLGQVGGITFATEAVAVEPAGPRVQLRGGDVIAATVESLDDERLVVSVAGPGGPQRLRIARDEVEAIVRGGPGAGSYRGPAGLEGWTQAPAGAWREEAGRILTDKAGAAVTRNVSAPARARYAIRLSRRRPAEFRICVAAAERSVDDGYVLQSVGAEPTGGFMLIRRVAGRHGARAAIEPLPAAPWRGDVLNVVLFVDQERGRLAVLLPDAVGADARKAFETTLPPADGAQVSGRFRLELNGGDICLERLEVTPWRGDQPTLRDAAETTVLTRDGEIEGFSVSSFDAAGDAYVLRRGAETRRVAAAEVAEIRFPAGSGTAQDAREATLRVVQSDGSVLSGDLVQVDDRAVWVRHRSIDAPVAVPSESIATIRAQRPEPQGVEPSGRVGTLVIGDDRIRGWLVDGGPVAAGGFAWQPVGSMTGASLVGDPPDAAIEYVARRPREERPDRRRGDVEVGGIGGLVNRDDAGFFIVAMMTEEGAAARDGRIQPGDRIVAIAPSETAEFVETKDLDNETVTQLLRGRVGTTVRLKMTDGMGANPRDIELARGPINVAGREILEQALQTHVRLAGAGPPRQDGQDAYPATIVLRSGDVAPCRIESIDAEKVTLRSPLTGGPDAAPVTVPAILVKAVELLPGEKRVELDKTLRTRLLTLPRMQRDRPPTHLLRLVGGDYLRGRLVAVDDEKVTFEVLDVVKQLPRAQVARLIWLHPEVPRAEGEDAAEDDPAEPEGLVVQGVATDGRRLTLLADGVEGNDLRGRSRAFGDAGIDLTKIDVLLIGGAVGRAGGELPFAQWTLKPAPEPRALSGPDEP